MRAAVYGRQSSNKAKSIAEQLKAGHAAILDNDWTHAGDYQDGRSASRYATKPRGGWAQVISDVENRSIDVLIVWESSRGDRKPAEWLHFLSLCRDTGVLIYVVMDDRTYDMRKVVDWKTLAHAGVDAAAESDVLSIRTKRGHAGAAASGLPPGGPVPFGYRRVFNSDTGVREGWVPDESKAVQVRDIYKRVGRGEPVLRIANDLGLTANAVRRIARNTLYLGVRSHNGTEHKGTWEPLVTPAAFRDAQQVLGDPARRITRPGRQKHLLTYLAVCDICEAPIEQAVGYYRCSRKRCVSAPMADTDAALTETMQLRLADLDALEAMATTDKTEAANWQAEADRLRGQVREWEAIAGQGQDSPVRVAGILRDLQARIETAERSSRTARLPAILRDVLDDPERDAAQWWRDASVVGRRQTLKGLAEVRIGLGMPGRLPGLSRRVRAMRRLAPSRWAGSEQTWGQIDPPAEIG